MNDSEIESALRRYRPDTPSGRAALFLYTLKEETNANSDGWHSWPLPARAANKLMQFLQGPEDAPTRSWSALSKALVPIKSFYTRRGYAAGMKWPEGF